MATRTRTPRPAAPPPTRLLMWAMYAGLALTVLATLVPLVDHYTADTLAGHVNDVYSGYVQTSATPVYGYLVTVGLLGTAAWLWMTWAVTRRKRWAPAATTTVVVLSGTVGLLNLVIEEYGSRLLPTLFGVVGVLPGLAGLVAVVLLWTRGRHAAGGEVSA